MNFENYRGHRVLVTGQTGFKGAWLCAWLAKLGAQVVDHDTARFATEAIRRWWRRMGSSA